jgi:pteridine reductase
VKAPLAGRVALVTGGAHRLGAAIVRVLAQEGANVAIHARRHAREGEAAARSLRRRGAKAVVLVADLEDAAATRGLVPACLDALGRIDVLVNNAGVFEHVAPTSPDVAVFDRAMAVNARAPYVLSVEAAKAMRARGEGAIVNVACASVYAPYTGYLAYSASKAALANLTAGLAKAFAPAVRVNAVAPGAILPPEGATGAQARQAVEATRLKRWGSPEDVARAVRFLVVDAPYVTGVVLPVDGGRHLA